MGIRSLVFCANLLFFCEQNSDLLFSKSESLPLCSLKKSDGVKSDRSDSLLGLKVGKAVKNCQKHDENNEISIESLVFESQRARERFAHGCKFKESDFERKSECSTQMRSINIMKNMKSA